MKKQLVTSVNVTCNCIELVVLGEVFYMRRTLFLKRLVRKVIHKVKVPINYFISVEEAKAEARRHMDEFVNKYYGTV